MSLVYVAKDPVTGRISKKKDMLTRMFVQSLKEGILHVPVNEKSAGSDISTYIIADTHRDDISIDQDWIHPSDAEDYDDYVPRYFVNLGKKQVEISSEKTFEEIIDILQKENIEVRGILRVQNLEVNGSD